MSVRVDPNGRRSIQVEVEVPGTPEQVWDAIASGPGVSSWFVPCEMEQRVGGTITSDFGGGMVSESKITEWEPGHRFAAQSDGWGEGSPAMATEWTVEAHSGGTCTVRVVHSYFVDKADWDGQLESIENGWPAYFVILHYYLDRFPGQPSTLARATGFVSGPEMVVWPAFLEKLGANGLQEGGAWQAPAGAPPGVGKMKFASDRLEHRYVLIETDQPTTGILFLNSSPMGDQVWIGVAHFFYGDAAASTVAEIGERWQEWLDENYPAQ